MSETIITVTIPDWFGWILVIWLIAAIINKTLEGYVVLLRRRIIRKLEEAEKLEIKDGN